MPYGPPLYGIFWGHTWEVGVVRSVLSDFGLALACECSPKHTEMQKELLRKDKEKGT